MPRSQEKALSVVYSDNRDADGSLFELGHCAGQSLAMYAASLCLKMINA